MKIFDKHHNTFARFVAYTSLVLITSLTTLSAGAYGAIAEGVYSSRSQNVNGRVEIYGVALNHANQEDANMAAIADCQSRSASVAANVIGVHSACEVKDVIVNTCYGGMFTTSVNPNSQALGGLFFSYVIGDDAGSALSSARSRNNCRAAARAHCNNDFFTCPITADQVITFACDNTNIRNGHATVMGCDATCNMPGQIRNSSNMCELCPAAQYVVNNTCTSCPNMQAVNSDRTGCEFTAASCASANQDFDSVNQQCRICASNQYFNASQTAGNRCSFCSAGEIPHTNGTSCRQCAVGETPGTTSPNMIQANGDSCVDCSDFYTEFSWAGGTCTECPSGQVDFADGGNSNAGCRGRCLENGTEYDAPDKNDVCQIQCTDMNMDYNETTHTCTSCSSGLLFAKTGDVCTNCASLTETRITGRQYAGACVSSCPSGFAPNPAGTLCECPTGESLNADGTGCNSTAVSCALKNQDFNAATGQCTVCPSNQYFDSSRAAGIRCVSCDAGQIPNSNGTGCSECAVGETPGTASLGETPGAINPVGDSCVDCGEFYAEFSWAGGICTECPSGQADFADGGTSHVGCRNKCMENGTEYDAPNKNDVCQIQCTDMGMDYDDATHTCTSCGSGELFTKTGDVCTNCASLTETGITGRQYEAACVSSCPVGFVSNSAGDACACPEGATPTSDGTGCDCGAGQVRVSGTCQDCAAGTFHNASTDSCETCPATQFSTARSTSCTTCNTGTFINAAQTECITCNAGTFYDSASRTCRDCAAGHVSDNNETECTACSAGTFENAANNSCDNCPVGRSSVSGSTTCTPCEPGLFNSDAGGACQRCAGDTIAENMETVTCTPCGVGQVANGLKTMCISCPAGAILLSDGSCEACTGDEVPNSSIDTCIPCEAGTLPTDNNARCERCPDGEIVNSAGNECVACPSGTFQDAANNANSCTDCAAGHVSDIRSDSPGDCTACPNGQIPDTARAQCELCPAGDFHNTNTHSCEPCANNSITAASGLTECTTCDLPQVSNAARDECVSCSPGSILGGDGQCQECPLGKTSNITLSECVDFSVQCPSNQIPTHGNICQTCPTGHVPDDTGFGCEACGVGTFAAAEDSQCASCPVGQINNDEGSDSCTSCQPGFVSNSAGTSCSACPVGTFENASANSCEQCNSTSIAASVGQASCTACPDKERANGLRTECVLCPVGEIIIGEGQCQQCPQGQTSDDNFTACIPISVNCEPNQIATVDNTCVVCDDGMFPADQFSCASCPQNTFAPQGAVSCLACLNGSVSADGSQCVCRDDQRLSNNSCVCANSALQETQDPRTGDGFCAAPIVTPVHTQYNVNNCDSNGWTSGISHDNNRNIAELCYIPLQFVDATPTLAVANVRETPQNETPVSGETASACILRAHSMFENNDALRQCGEIFGPNNGLPLRRAQFNRDTDMLLVNVESFEVYDPTNGNQRVDDRFINPPESDGGGENVIVAGLGAIGVVGVVTWLVSDGDLSLLNWTPHMNIEQNNSRGYFDYGSRIEFANDNWKTYWSARQSHQNGNANDWIYGAGATWHDDIWRGTFTTRTEGVETDMAFAFAAETTVGAWKLRSGVEADWGLTELNSEWASRLQIKADTDLQGWLLTPSLGFSWEEGVSRLGEDGYIRLDISREL